MRCRADPGYIRDIKPISAPLEKLQVLARDREIRVSTPDIKQKIHGWMDGLENICGMVAIDQSVVEI